MKETLLTVLRDRHTSRHHFRHATEQLSLILAGEAGHYLKKKKRKVFTPLTETKGNDLPAELVIIPILRAGLAMLPSFLRLFPDALVGFFGMRRDEISKQPQLYYQNLPVLSKEHAVILIDPMIATGGSGLLALRRLKEKGIIEKNIIYVGIVAAPEGIANIKKECPEIRLVVAKIDDHLNKDAFIVPGIGDFGDRYFGTDNPLP
jgi:uracil phosphoribosyltransferase